MSTSPEPVVTDNRPEPVERKLVFRPKPCGRSTAISFDLAPMLVETNDRQRWLRHHLLVQRFVEGLVGSERHGPITAGPAV